MKNLDAHSGLRCLACLLLIGWLACGATVVLADGQPNIIFILCDDLGWGDLGVFHQNDSKHDRRHRTPGLDRMADEGMQLRMHYCPAPVCAPSRASLLTGVHQGHAEIRDNQFDKMLPDNHTLASVLKYAGYRTALIGKYGLQGAGDRADNWTGYPTRRGFDEFFGYVSHYDGHIHYPADNWLLGDSEGHRTPKPLWHNQREVSMGLQNCYTTDLFTAKSKHWITEHVRTQPRQPFFLYLAYDTPHAALQVPSVEYPAGGGLNGGVRWDGLTGRMINTARGEIDSYIHPDYRAQGWSDVEARFATMVRRIDSCVADLLQTLRDLNIDENTLVVLTSDNGPHHESYLQGKNYDPTSFESFGRFEGTKRDVWEAGIRVPALAWWPGSIRAGRISRRASQFHDWLPTFAAMAGIPAPARTDGVSLLPTLTGHGVQRPSTIYVEYWQRGSTKKYSEFAAAKRGHARGQMQVLHMDGYKGLRTDIRSHQDPFAIYNLRTDPGERHNLAGSSQEFDVLQKRMQDRVLQIRRPNATAVRPYDQEFVPPVQVDRPVPGLRWDVGGCETEWVPRIADLPTCSKGITSTTGDVFLMTAGPKRAVRFSGYLRVAKQGSYTFTLTSQTRAFLHLHDTALIDADYGYLAGSERSATIRLKPGFHPIRVTGLTDSTGRIQLGLRWAANGSGPKPISAELLFH